MTRTAKHIGIVGCSSEGAALCYKTICTQSAKLMGEHAHPEVSMHTHSLADYVKCLDSKDLAGVGDLMLSSAKKLSLQGADFLICPDNTIHQAFDYVAKRSPLPWLNIASVLVENAKARGFKKLGILGTQWLVQSNVYPEQIDKNNLTWVRPEKQEIDEIGRLIMQELVNGIFKPHTIAYFKKVIINLKEKGCDAVILGCTEIPLIINDANSALPTLDSNRLLAEAAIKYALKES
ncbi:aspartate/glutamate racemase family protein [Pseudoalteromonas denitrificans]|uniref:Aspartate racemase n=1 Tax=Pseudoalteromonas denitrificans DSM 6059 TaxID=1123010 RepID=A0A1I1RXE1_9GAMM|nr:amino acid racemase [Pseudoalteromonas denitrificans]SFD38925.1 aspartate racemase [Pseudoalteromonas denitrificans DSM 6059]